MSLADFRRAFASQLIAVEASIGLLVIGFAIDAFLPSIAHVGRLLLLFGAAALALSLLIVAYLAVFVIESDSSADV